MKIMKQKWIWTTAIVLILSMISTQVVFAQEVATDEEQNTIHEQGEEMTAAAKAKAAVEHYGAVSVQYALIEDGNITVSGHTGVYSKTENKALTKDTMYGIGSVSKVFTATAVMKLVEQGKIDLDRPVTDYIPEFKMADERYKKITVRMLLNHSSGLLGSTYPSGFLLADADTTAHDRLLENLAKQRLKADPGAFSVYCNDGYMLAELLVERVSGMSFTQFLRENITTPLKLSNTKTPQDSFDQSELAKVYYPSIETALPPDTVNIIGTGGIYSTAEDLCRFAQIFMAKQGNTGVVLSEKFAQAMAADEYKKGMWPDGAVGMSYGLGWDDVAMMTFEEYGLKALEKGGDTMLSHGTLVVIPEKNMAAAVMSSGGTSLYDRLIAESLLLEALQKKGIVSQEQLLKQNLISEESDETLLNSGVASPAPAGSAGHISGKKDGNKSIDVLENRAVYNGYYANMGSVMKADITADGHLEITIPAVADYKESYLYRGNGIFTDKLGLTKVSFVKEENGNIYLNVGGTSYVEKMGQSYSSQYTAQKLKANPQADHVTAAWQERSGKKYYKLDEKYTSQFYFLMMPAVKIILRDVLPGYVGSAMIEDENHTKSVLEIPGMMGRDLQEYTFYDQDGAEYLFDGANVSLSEDAVPVIYGGTGSISTIGEDGYANWYKVGDQAGKTMAVKFPAQGSFAVYDQKGSYVAASWADGKNTVVLPGNGMIVFAGEPSSQFQILIK